MAHLPRWEKEIFTEINWYGYAAWWQTATDEERDATKDLWVLVHINQEGKYANPMVHNIRGNRWPLPQKECKEENCRRCKEKIGGWQWCWRDRRWTCEAAMMTHLTKAEAFKESYKAWPKGCNKMPGILNLTAPSLVPVPAQTAVMDTVGDP